MLRTALASVCFALLSYAAAHWLTHDFQVWTTEGARRLEVALQPVPAPAVAMAGPGIDGRPLGELLSDGRSATIVDFMYTRCNSVCSVLGSTFQQLQATLRQQEGKAPPVRLLSISFDAAHDDVPALQRQAARLGADPTVWRFARAADAADEGLLLDRYRVTVIPDGLGGYEHNAALLVFDPAGRLVRILDYEQIDTALAFAQSLADKQAP